jgi:hypothetical protein
MIGGCRVCAFGANGPLVPEVVVPSPCRFVKQAAKERNRLARSAPPIQQHVDAILQRLCDGHISVRPTPRSFDEYCRLLETMMKLGDVDAEKHILEARETQQEFEVDEVWLLTLAQDVYWEPGHADAVKVDLWCVKPKAADGSRGHMVFRMNVAYGPPAKA